MQKKNPIYGGFFKGGAELFALFLFLVPSYSLMFSLKRLSVVFGLELQHLLF